MNFIEAYIILTFIHVLFLKKKRNNILLIFILFISAVNELCLQFFSKQSISTNIYVFLLYICWLYILLKIFVLDGTGKLKYFVIAFFIFSCLVNVLIYKSWIFFNFYDFTIGALLYCSVFLIQSYVQLKQENFNFFSSNYYLLISSPIIFFLGMSFLFAFGSSELFSIKIYKDTTVYTIVGHFVNFIYYSLINWYIYKENKSHVHV